MGTTNNGSGRRLTIICSADMASGTCSALSADVYALTGQELELRVAYDVNQTPLPGQGITFKLLTQNAVATPNNSVDGSSLLSQAAQTDDNGVAVARVRIGAVETNFIIEASAAEASPVRWRVAVGNAGVGAFSVRVLYPMGRYTSAELSKADVFLFNRQGSNETCATLSRNPTMIRNADVLVTIGDELRPYSEVDNIGVVNGLPADGQYTIAALLYGGANVPVGFGCLDSQRVVGGRQTRVDVNVSDLPNSFKGIYNALHRFDLRMALATSDSDSLRNLNDLLDVLHLIGGDDARRAEALRELICDFGDTLCNSLAGIGASLVGGVIEDIVLDDNPDLLRTLEGLSELVGMVEDFRVLGKIEFYRASSDVDGWLRENETRWEKLRLTWRGQQRDFVIGDLTSVVADPDGRQRIISAFFDGYLNGRTMEIAEHNMDIKLGIILLGIAEYWVLPEIVGLAPPVSVEEVLQELLPCDAIDNTVNIMGFCRDDIAPAIATIIRDQIGNLQVSADGLTLSGTTIPEDVDGDLSIDNLTSGVWIGSFTETNRFFGCFNGCKCIDATCSCQPSDCTVPTNLNPTP
ncbi:MAG: hypothetical protein ACPGQS_02505 [Bradymonadia bacterium]